MKRISSVTFQNSFVGVGNGGVINVNGTQYSSPTSSFPVVELNAITAAAQYHFINGNDYTFSQWNDGNTSSSRTFYPSNNATYTASFTGKPSISNRGLYTNSTPGQYVTLYWNEHPNQNVTEYRIFRRVKRNGIVYDHGQIAAVSRGTLSFVDYSYVITNGYTDDLLWYDVRPFYQTEGTTSDPSYAAVYGKADLSPNVLDGNVESASITKEIPTEYSLTNYPNPFNPTTTINYQLPQDGMVTIKVYDMLGREVATLVNENKSAGYYKAEFDASRLTSGVYIYTISVNKYSQSKKMLLAK